MLKVIKAIIIIGPPFPADSPASEGKKMCADQRKRGLELRRLWLYRRNHSEESAEDLVRARFQVQRVHRDCMRAREIPFGMWSHRGH